MKQSHFYTMTFMTLVCMLIIPLTGFAQTTPVPPGNTSRKIVPQPKESLDVKVWLDKQCGSPYAQGEKIIINFRVNKDAYMTIYDVDTQGQVSVLFPNRHHPDNYVKGNQTYTIPNPNYSYDLVIEGPPGIEYVDAVASTDPYYHWNYNRGEPGWTREWGLKNRSFNTTPPSSYKRSQEYQNRPDELGAEGERSIAKNYAITSQLRDQIQHKIVTRPRTITEQPRTEEYGTATCYFYVVSSSPYPPQPPQPQPYPSAEDYLRQQQRDFQQIPGFNATQSGNRLIVTIPNTILFDFDSYALRYEARRDLDRVTDILLRYPETSIIVAGHTDSTGDANYNQRLSEYRAQAVSNYLISRGVQSYRISSVGYGETQPVASNATERGRQRNRRVELDIRANQTY